MVYSICYFVADVIFAGLTENPEEIHAS